MADRCVPSLTKTATGSVKTLAAAMSTTRDGQRCATGRLAFWALRLWGSHFVFIPTSGGLGYLPLLLREQSADPSLTRGVTGKPVYCTLCAASGAQNGCHCAVTGNLAVQQVQGASGCPGECHCGGLPGAEVGEEATGRLCDRPTGECSYSLRCHT